MSGHSLKLFYDGDRLATVYSNNAHCRRISASPQNIGETSSQAPGLRLLGVDRQNSTLYAMSESLTSIAYSPFGQDNLPEDSLLISRFTGERQIPMAGGYLLGNGYRVYNPAMMRFYRPDALAPFDKGGVNAYAYCKNDPLNYTDPSGRFVVGMFKRLRSVHRSQLYSQLNKMEINRDKGMGLTPENSFGQRRYRALVKLAAKDYKDSTLRLGRAEETRYEADVEIQTNPERYTLKQLERYNRKIDKKLYKYRMAHQDDIETARLIEEIQEVTHEGKTRYYLPPSQTIAQPDTVTQPVRVILKAVRRL
jgi:RHS repeat-associated protein